MLVKLPSGLKIAVPPIFFWDARGADLTIRSRSAFSPKHVTSRLCLELLAEHLGSAPCGRLFDIGCGSGVLALASAVLGVPTVLGLDIDARAIQVSRENAQRNRLDQQCHWFVGTVACVRGGFPCVVANLPYLVLQDILWEIVALIEPGGSLILSGFHDIQWHGLRETLICRGLQIEKECSGDLSFCGEPPSGSYTWMAVRARLAGVKALSLQ